MKARGLAAVVSLVLAFSLVLVYPTGPLPAAPFIRGDTDYNGRLEMTDAVRILGFLFRASPRFLTCKDAADANDSGTLDISDGIYLLSFLFAGGPPLPGPSPACGEDPTEDALGCPGHSACPLPPLPFCEQRGQLTSTADAGGHSLRYQVAGVGCPAVVMDAGLGDSGLFSWAPIFAQVSAMSRTLVYDRAGYGGSDAGPVPRTSEQIVTELHALLTAIDFEPPYILVGHSLGGVHIRLYASRFPEETAGLVFVDGSHEHFFTEWQARFPEIFEGWQRENDTRLAALPGALAEWRNVKEILPALGMPVPLPDVPAVVLTGLKPELASGIYTEEFNTASSQWWFDAHVLLVASLPRGTHLSTDRSGHYIHHDEPELVVEAILQVLAAAREAPEEAGVAMAERGR